jgi:hypothetical protein
MVKFIMVELADLVNQAIEATAPEGALALVVPTLKQQWH